MTDLDAPDIRPAYEQALRSGRLTEDQWLIWAQLFRHRTLSTQSLARLLSPEPYPSLPEVLTEMERLGFIARESVRLINYWSALPLQQLPVAPPAPPPRRREQLLQRLGQSVLNELEAGAAQADPAACVRRWESAVRELGLR